MGVLGLFLLGSCNSKSGDSHEGHNHETEEHNHDGHDHEHEGHNHEHEEQENHAGGSDEIILPPAKAQAAGVAVSTVEPGSFHQVIKTSGQVMAAQGDESVAVATVAGVVSFKGKVIEGMSVSKGTPLVVLSSKNMADGDPVQKARIAYEVSKKEYERMKALVGNKSYLKRNSRKPNRFTKMPVSVTRQSQRTIRQAARRLFLPSAVM